MTTQNEKPTIVFVHGLWADGSCWNKVIAELQAKGYETVSAQNPTTSLSDDVTAVKRAMDRVKGPIILVGHSWGGMVITQFADDPRIKGLVYIAAQAPDKDETTNTLLKSVPANHLNDYLVTINGFITLSKEGMEKGFAQDLSKEDQMILFATQAPAGAVAFDDKSASPAWKVKPTWYILTKRDETVPPQLQKNMATRAKAKITELDANHVVMLSKPKEVTKVILEAAGSI
ncbi:alpha/beta hydrolase [Pedobacter aquatilis]|uniref:alpha/beta fold hydrolase n=1 Tax=Pedobacter aquatilis TaxID=351343 RepID=UPI00292E4914|nr:alpha/beta hydrolase [Pedobacter aquatilis]